MIVDLIGFAVAHGSRIGLANFIYLPTFGAVTDDQIDFWECEQFTDQMGLIIVSPKWLYSGWMLRKLSSSLL
jgi:hypothetical protein